MSEGSLRKVCEIAAWTSCATESISRSRVKDMLTRVLPRLLVDDMESSPAIVENCFSSGMATAEAIVSGLPPGSEARTSITG